MAFRTSGFDKYWKTAVFKKCNFSLMYINVSILLISLSDTTANPEKNYLAKDHNTESSLSAGKIKLVKDLGSLFSLLTVYLFTLRVKLVTSHYFAFDGHLGNPQISILSSN